MAVTIKVECQDFVFGASWDVLPMQYDDTPDYKKLLQGTPSANAVDLVGNVGGRIYLIEVKDYRSDGQSKSSADLAIWVSTKVRDSIAGMLGFQRSSTMPDQWRRFVKQLARPDGKPVVVLFVEDYELYVKNAGKLKPKREVLRELLKQKLSWLCPDVFVVSASSQGLPDLLVANRPGAAGHKHLHASEERQI